MNLTVIIKNSDLHDTGSTKLKFSSFSSRYFTQLQEELLVRLPLVVVHDGDADLEQEHVFKSAKEKSYLKDQEQFDKSKI